MKIWLITFLFLFSLIEFLLWLKQFISPLPIYLLAGAFLAIASNYEKAKFLLPTTQGFFLPVLKSPESDKENGPSGYRDP